MWVQNRFSAGFSVLGFKFWLFAKVLISDSLALLTLAARIMKTGTPMDIFYTALHLIVSITKYYLGFFPPLGPSKWKIAGVGQNTSIRQPAEWQLHANAINLDVRLEASWYSSFNSNSSPQYAKFQKWHTIAPAPF